MNAPLTGCNHKSSTTRIAASSILKQHFGEPEEFSALLAFDESSHVGGPRLSAGSRLRLFRRHAGSQSRTAGALDPTTERSTPLGYPIPATVIVTEAAPEPLGVELQPGAARPRPAAEPRLKVM